MQPQTSFPPAGKPSLFGIITSPEKQFARIKEHPTVWIPMILLTIVTTLLTGIQMYFVANDPQIFQEMMNQGMKQSGDVPINSDMIKTFTIVFGMIGGLFAIPLSSVIGAFFTWIFVLLFQGEAKFREILSFMIHLMVLSVLSLFVNLLALVAFGINPMEGSVTSLASVLPVEGMMKGLLTVVDVFMIWGMVLTANGLKVIARLSSGKAWAISIIFMIIAALFYTAIYSLNSFGA